MLYNILFIVAFVLLIGYGAFLVVRTLAKKKREEEARAELEDYDDSDEYDEDD